MLLISPTQHLVNTTTRLSLNIIACVNSLRSEWSPSGSSKNSNTLAQDLVQLQHQWLHVKCLRKMGAIKKEEDDAYKAARHAVHQLGDIMRQVRDAVILAAMVLVQQVRADTQAHLLFSVHYNAFLDECLAQMQLELTGGNEQVWQAEKQPLLLAALNTRALIPGAQRCLEDDLVTHVAAFFQHQCVLWDTTHGLDTAPVTRSVIGALGFKLEKDFDAGVFTCCL